MIKLTLTFFGTSNDSFYQKIIIYFFCFIILILNTTYAHEQLATIPNANELREGIKNYTTNLQESLDFILPSFKEVYKEVSDHDRPYFFGSLKRALHQLDHEIAKGDYSDELRLISTNTFSPSEIATSLLIYKKGRPADEIIAEYQKVALPHNPIKQLLQYTKYQDLFIQYVKKLTTYYDEQASKTVPDIVFRPESGLVFPYGGKKYVFLGTFTAEHGKGKRLAEVSYNRTWFEENGFIIKDPGQIPFEGGAEVKYVKHGDSVDILFGYGIRSSEQSVEWVSNEMAKIVGHGELTWKPSEISKSITTSNGKTIRFIKAKVVDETFYHIDTTLKEIPVLHNGKIVKETIMYYPKAFDEKTQILFRTLYPEAEILSRQEVDFFAANSPMILDTIIMDHRLQKLDISRRLQKRGIKIKFINLDEFFKAGGGGKCLICEIDSDLFSLSFEANNEIQMIGSTTGVFDRLYTINEQMKGELNNIKKLEAEKQHINLARTLKEVGGEDFIIHRISNQPFKRHYEYDMIRWAIYLHFEGNIAKMDLEFDQLYQDVKTFLETNDLKGLKNDSIAIVNLYNDMIRKDEPIPYALRTLSETIWAISEKYPIDQLLFKYPEILREFILKKDRSRKNAKKEVLILRSYLLAA